MLSQQGVAVASRHLPAEEFGDYWCRALLVWPLNLVPEASSRKPQDVGDTRAMISRSSSSLFEIILKPSHQGGLKGANWLDVCGVCVGHLAPLLTTITRLVSGKATDICARLSPGVNN